MPSEQKRAYLNCSDNVNEVKMTDHHLFLLQALSMVIQERSGILSGKRKSYNENRWLW